LSGNLAAEWDLFRKSLIGAGVSIRDTPDQLLWTGGNSSGILSVKNAYMALFSTFNIQFMDWRHKIWKWDIQLKIKLFIWLALEQFFFNLGYLTEKRMGRP
jgi:hypothetical protein